MEPLPRRSMSQALQTDELPAEALDLIRAGSPKPLSNRASVAPSIVESVRPELERKPSAATAPAGLTTTSIQPSLAGEGNKMIRPRVKEAETDVSGMVVTASFRIPSEIPNALLRASVDRKIKKLKPWTQQDIAAEALSQWLKRNGYSI